MSTKTKTPEAPKPIELNCYQLKFSIKKRGFQGKQIQGLVYEETQEKAVALARASIEKAINKEDLQIEIKILSALKLKIDFTFYPKKQQP